MNVERRAEMRMVGGGFGEEEEVGGIVYGKGVGIWIGERGFQCVRMG